jgi:hypothetical protein
MRNIRPKPPSITLAHLLKRRGHTFGSWMTSAGISSYPEVLRWCTKIGVLPPTEDEYKAFRPQPQTAPADGIVVCEAPQVEEVGSPLDTIQADAPNGIIVVEDKKKRSRKKSETAEA